MRHYIIKKCRLFSFISAMALGFSLSVNSLVLGCISLALCVLFDFLSCRAEVQN